MSESARGQLYIVATPIGNLGDISRRAVDILRTADLILCEDTRVAGRLLAEYGIDVASESLHEHNEYDKCREIVAALSAGKHYALISDAGLPTISDPGRILVSEALSAGIRVTPVPGACAAVSGLAVSGMDAARFVFEGFLPPTAVARKQRLEVLKGERRTLVFYEAPHRVKAMLQDIVEVLGDEREVCLAKELTKIYETVVRGTANELIAWLDKDERRCKGEFVVVVAGQSEAETMTDETVVLWLSALLKHLPPREAAGVVAEISGMSKNNLYQLALKISDKIL